MASCDLFDESWPSLIGTELVRSQERTFIPTGIPYYLIPSYIQYCDRDNVEILRPDFPKFPNYGVMHSKLILIFRPDSLRVVVSTANLVEYDYSEVQNVSLTLQDIFDSFVRLCMCTIWP